MTPSPQQLAIREAYLLDRTSLFIEAGAGCGKTSTCVWLCKETVPQGEKTIVLAFNRDIAEELKARMPYWITPSTFHSLCNRPVREFLASRNEGKWPGVEKDKCKFLLKEEVSDWSVRKEIQDDVLRCVSFAKAFGVAALPDAPSMSDIADDLGLDDEVKRIAGVVLQRSNAMSRQIDFDDMLYLPLLHNIELPKCRNLFVDEAQDTNPTQLALIERLLFPGGRVVAVGDPRQAIYGFRGADRAACDAFKRRFGMKTLPLSVSYRCARTVVDEANHYLLNPKPQRKRRRAPEDDFSFAEKCEIDHQLNSEDDRPY